MKQKIISLLLVVGITVLCPFAGWAQKGLKIQYIFDRYGKQKNVTMVELSKEMLETYGMKLYKSITIKGSEKALADIRHALAADQEGAKKIKEIVEEGQLVSAFYQLTGKNEGEVNRFILFKVGKKETVTLVYIEGDLDSEDLVTLLFTKRDL
ncbi:DUF6108 family protein [Parabacteroides pacaensis]|uniref:DUF6108 family protein n=1 Tax=Parabacteroides pacaensis TaxID=2086575 RepID=UPI000D0FFC94|nr:DUF6108 family protein [Parabacteroides pacaensis]